jgi:uncharacterized protein YegP (UPF0339 family)
MAWEVVVDNGENWYWRLRDGETVIARSLRLRSKEECLKQIELVKSASVAAVRVI